MIKDSFKHERTYSMILRKENEQFLKMNNGKPLVDNSKNDSYIKGYQQEVLDDEDRRDSQ